MTSLESFGERGGCPRHQDFRSCIASEDGTAPFARDATFRAQPGAGGADVRLASVNELGAQVRHYAAEVWAAVGGGGHAFGTPVSHPEDVCWAVAPAWN